MPSSLDKLTVYRVVFERANGKYITLGEVKEETDKIDPLGQYPNCRKIIDDFLDKHNYKMYYSRQWVGTFKFQKGKYNYPALVIDVGSHSEFFYIVQMNHWQDKKINNNNKDKENLNE